MVDGFKEFYFGLQELKISIQVWSVIDTDILIVEFWFCDFK